MLKPALLATWLAVITPVAAAEEGSPRQDPAPPPGETIHLLAWEQEQVAEGHVRALGDVDLTRGDVRLQADRVELWEAEMRVVAEGNVVLQQGDQKIVGTRIEVNLEDGTGKFYNAYGVAGSDFYFYGDVVERESEDVYVIHRGAFTACTQPVPRWRFTAGRARVRRDHHVRLHHAFLKVKSIPVLYLPFLYYPIDEDERSTGFLMPRIGNSSFKGFMVSEAFFWAINRSMDATFSVERYARSGVGVGTEYRYVASDTSRGDFRTFLLDDQVSGNREYSLNYSLNQDLPGEFKAVAHADFFSSFDFQQRYQESFDAATRRSKRASGNVYRSWSQYQFRLLFDRNDTSFGNRVAVRQILPRITLGSRPSPLLGSPLLFSFDTEASRLSRSVGEELVEYQRWDVVPSVSYPFTKLPYLTFRSTLTGRYTRYTAQEDRGTFLDEPVDRRYFDFTLDTRGPTFARIFDTPGNFYAERYKHVIEPQFVYSYRSRVDTFDLVPKFDSADYMPGTNQLAFSLVNRFFAKQKQGEGTGPPVEFLTWALSQRYFFNANASLYDRQFSTPFFSPDGEPSSYSPVSSKLTFRPNPGMHASWNFDYDVNFKKLISMSLVGGLGGPGWGSVNASWTRRAFLQNDVVRNNLRGGANLRVSGSVQTQFETSYDLSFRDLQHLRAGITYDIQCCGFQFEYTRYNFGSFREENLFRFGITLENVGSFGTFLGGQGRVQ